MAPYVTAMRTEDDESRMNLPAKRAPTLEYVPTRSDHDRSGNDGPALPFGRFVKVTGCQPPRSNKEQCQAWRSRLRSKQTAR